MVLLELTPEELARSHERAFQTEQNIAFLQKVLGRGKRRSRKLTSPSGAEIFICDGRFMEEKDRPHLAEQVHVLTHSVRGAKCYSVYPGRLDVWTMLDSKLRRTTINFQNAAYDTIISSLALTIRLCLPRSSVQLPLPKP